MEGTKRIEGLALKLPRTNEVIVETEAFKKMKRLRLLQLDHVPLEGDYKYLPRNIRWLYWHGCPSKYIPREFYMGSLVAADLKYSKLKIFWRQSQGSTTSEFGDCFLLGDKCSNWLMFEGEGSSVLFSMPQVIGCSLKAMTLHIVYSSSLANMTSIHPRSVLIVNHTKSTIQIHKKEVLISPSVEEWMDMISDLEAGDKVEFLVVFGHGLAMKKATVYLIYSELVDDKTECS
ncbi:TMV resistance protein N-like isoform X3 [Senna tora]|uniref:TMV resistance protein N-like isoform X3 n=1 Tax=Senna tora TaxID=362788 RepID=A0A834XGZ7_9FABA|nr:TMV resistance protein N-like isoform X3 [Senna tora]